MHSPDRVDVTTEESRGSAGVGRWSAYAGLAVLAALLLSALLAPAQPPRGNGPPAGLGAALAVERAAVAAIERAERSVVAIARVRHRRATPPEPGATPSPRPTPTAGDSSTHDVRTDPTSPDFVPNEFASGVVIDRRGFIVTNYHVLGDPAENDYWVWVGDKPYQVQEVHAVENVVAADPWTDLAVLKIKAENLQPIAFGDPKELRKGSFVIALGNPYALARDGEVSASWGIVANLLRKAPLTPRAGRSAPREETLHHYGTLIQTDARLNLGTSGGALVNLRGEMVGLTTSWAALAGYETAAGFALPVDKVFRRAVDALKRGDQPTFGFLGVQTRDVSQAERRAGIPGVRVESIYPATPAATAGFRADDVITHVDRVAVGSQAELYRELGGRSAETQVVVTVERGRSVDGFAGIRRGRPMTLTAQLAKRYTELRGPAYSRSPPRRWRGVRVVDRTELPAELFLDHYHLMDDRGCVAVRSVTRDSAGWNAGLRRGAIITHVQGRRVANADDFYRAAPDGGDAELRVADAPSRSRKLTVSEPTE